MIETENNKKGLKISRYYSKENVHPFNLFNYEKRSSVIKNQDGSIVFEMNNVEVPTFWSQVATDILAQKYLRKTGVPIHNEDGELCFDENGQPLIGGENSIKQVAHRIAGCWCYWGERFNHFASEEDAQIFYDEMVYMIINQTGSPNSPQWFTTGLHWAYGLTGSAQGHSYVDPFTKKLEYSPDAYSRSQPHACFIQSVEDNLISNGGIFDLLVREARVFKYGSGSGSNFSRVRGKGERLTGGGTSSGLMSFLKIFDAAAGSIKSGGTTRRAAKMVCLDLDHPEIRNFIWWKVKEEEKVAGLVTGSKIMKEKINRLVELIKGKENYLQDKEVRAAIKAAAKDNIPINYIVRSLNLAKQGYELNLTEFNTHYESEAYQTVSGQNSNNSIRIPNSFFAAVEEGKDWNLIARTTGEVFNTIPARKLWDEIGYCAWASADPGVQYDTTINEWHTCPNSGRINGSNPCVTGDTKVLIDGGRWVRIDQLLEKKSIIITNKDKIQEAKIEGSFLTGEKPVYKLETKCGYEIKVTADHQIYTVNKGFVQACDLTKDDFVLLPGQEVSTITTVQDKIFYQMLGVYLGDGCGGEIHVNRGIQFTMNKECELNILEKFANYVAETYERVTHKESPAKVRIGSTSGIYAITNQKLIADFNEMLELEKLGPEKKISEQIFGLPLGAQKYVLQGLFTADGTVANYGQKSQYVALDSTCLQLLKDAQMLLLGFGIKSKIYQNRRAGKDSALLPDGKGGIKEYKVKEMHSLRLSRSSRFKFEKLIGFMEESHKSQKLKELNDAVTTYQDKPIDSVKSFEYLGVEKVYDLTEPLTNTFIANGITVHNCSEYMFLDNTACNLSSINLVRFYDDEIGHFDIAGYKHAIRLWSIASEISTLMAHFVSEQMAINSYEYRTIGLGFANLGTLLMLQGIPYDSEEGRTFASSMAAILTGEAYAASAELASILGSFQRYEENKEAMLRVIRNHRRAVYDRKDYEGLTIKPLAINQNLCPRKLLDAVHESWDKALRLGETYGYRNAQVSVLAPTGTTGLVMDCDTTGVEPDYALVKYKKLAGGGFFKIVNQSVPKALKKLGYSETEIKEIVDYCLGKGTFRGCPEINKESLMSKGLNEEQIDRLEKELPMAMEINFVFNPVTIGKEFYQKIIAKGDGCFLAKLGFSEEEIKAANDYICGIMCLENAPHLRKEHYPVFDCANKCGKNGVRYIHPYGHIKMLAAVQPFISGAISKTINMPNDWTVGQIKQAYYNAWKMMCKATALYRDGCKLSQPLNTTLEENNELKEILDEPEEEKEIAAASKFIKIVKLGTRKLSLTGTVRQEQLAEIMVQMEGNSPVQAAMLNAVVNGVNLALRNGLSPAMIAEESLNVEGHPVIKELKEFLGEFGTCSRTYKEKRNDEGCVEKCKGCGATQLRRNGTCMLCEVCGETTGCS